MDANTHHPKPVKISLRLRLPLLSLIILLLGALFLPDRVWNTLLIGFGGMFVVAYLWVWQLGKGLHGRRQLQSRWVSVGDQLEELFELGNNSPVPALWVEMIDHSNVPGYQAAVVRSPGNNMLDRWRGTAVCQQRGQYYLGPWTIRTGDPFGIFTMSRHYPQTNEIIIHPPIHTQLPVHLPAGQSHGRHRAQQRSWQATYNAATVRPYFPGDPLRWIHWPTSARHGDLFVRQFDLDAAGDIWILLDMSQNVQVGNGPDGAEEHAVLLAASLAARALRHNRKVGLAGYGNQPQLIPPGQGEGQQWRILHALALIQADGQTPLISALQDLGQIAQKNCAAIIITPSPHTDWIPQLLHLAHRGIESAVILLDRPSFGGTGNPLVQQKSIQRLGLTCTISRQGEVGIPAYTPDKKSKFRVTPMGRVVVVR
ncbi:MAG: DUF58 domain-containing protein [Chloroflexi bacterium]|nr:DUF58 domain-containing protein [Chloroflexota bacterium]